MEPTKVYLKYFLSFFIFRSISKQPAVNVEQPNFVSGLAVLFVLLYDFNLQYQEEVACTLATEVSIFAIDIYDKVNCH
jgi:uncharacterized membrane protein YiaA